MKSYSVSEVNRFIRQIFLSEEIFYSISVHGELSNFYHHRSGHFYFTLRDRDSIIKCVMFRGEAERVRFVPQNGMQVTVRGDIRVYEQGGVYQIYVTRLERKGDEAAEGAQELLELTQKLLREGLFDGEKKRPLPERPRVVGVVTSPDGAALADIKQVLSRRCPVVTLRLFGAQVQGDGAALSLCRALRAAQKNLPDVLILGRGGGSQEDLSAFNDERVVRLTAGFPVPVVSAVGHETDHCLCDLAADLRAPTPSAAAELVVPDRQQLKKEIDNQRKMLYNQMQEKMTRRRAQLDALCRQLEAVSPENQLMLLQQNLTQCKKRLAAAREEMLSSRRRELAMHLRLLETLGPYRVLKRGYAIVFDKTGRVVHSASEVAPGEQASVQLSDGGLRVCVKEKAETIIGEEQEDG